jgi:hypothetical protein
MVILPQCAPSLQSPLLIKDFRAPTSLLSSTGMHSTTQLTQVTVSIQPIYQAPRSASSLLTHRLRTDPIYGPRNTGPIMGNCLRNPKTTGKKSPKRLINPNTSTDIPINGRFTKINITPPKNNNVPRIFCFLAKKWYVFFGPIIKGNPEINRISLSGTNVLGGRYVSDRE